MQDTDVREIGLHLRKIQFLISITIVGLMTIIFGYRNPQMVNAIKELQRLDNMPESWKLSGSEDSPTLLDLRKSWDEALEKIPIDGLLAFNTEGSIVGTDPLPELSRTTSDSLNNCAGYFTIERTNYVEYTERLREKSISSIKCAWLGENHLFVISSTSFPMSKLNWLLVTFTGGQSATTDPDTFSSENDAPTSRRTGNDIDVTLGPRQSASQVTEALGAESLDQCKDWHSIERNDFTQFTNVINEFGWQGPVWCAWKGEDQLVFAPIDFHRGDQYPPEFHGSDQYMVTHNDIRAVDASRLDWTKPLLRRIEGKDFSSCLGTAKPENLDTLNRAIGHDLQDEVYMCYWINPNNLVVGSIDWKKLPYLEDRKDLTTYVGKEYTKAFPVLSFLESTETLNPQEPVNAIANILKAQRIQLDENMSILGVPAKGNILLTGGPVLLIVLQLYFLVHFRHLLSKISENTAPPSVPWIGVYRDRLSRLIMLLTLCLIPPVANSILFIHVGDYWFLLAIAISFSMSTWTFFLLKFSWSDCQGVGSTKRSGAIRRRVTQLFLLFRRSSVPDTTAPTSP